MMGSINLHVSDEAFPYLVIQRGQISRHAGDRARWMQAYNASLEDDYASIKPFLPAQCKCILDIGSGLGGIDAVLSRHYRGAGVVILDGENDAPKVKRHYETFNSMAVAKRFLESNGVADITMLTPDAPAPGLKADLVLSLKSWCFHYNPETYLPFVLSSTRQGSIVIVDIRRDYKTWLAVLERNLFKVGVAFEGKKYARTVFRVP